MRAKPSRRCAVGSEDLESRLCLASSVGWDGTGLGAAALTYSISGSISSLGASGTRAAIETALNAWSAAARVTFTPTNTPGLARSIDFTFGNIDGSGGTLAQGYYPNDLNREPVAGDIKFDSSESWEVGNAKGSGAFDLVLTAVHEIGHALGLDHSSAAGSIMAATVSANQSFTSLPSTDVNAIRGLYASTGTTTTTTPTNTNTTNTTTTTFPTFTFPWRFRRPRIVFRPAIRGAWLV